MKVAPNSQSILKFITFKKGEKITPPPPALQSPDTEARSLRLNISENYGGES
jgi:hypothetical protein